MIGEEKAELGGLSLSRKKRRRRSRRREEPAHYISTISDDQITVVSVHGWGRR